MNSKSTLLRAILLLVIWMSISFSANSQYTLLGSTSSSGPDCFILTPDANSQAGAVWNNSALSLTYDFDMTFQVYLGSNDANGADGIAFVLQTDPNALGWAGGGIGYGGLIPSIAVEYDTYQGDDPEFDHISVQRNGDINYSGAVAGPVQASAVSDNIEDGVWHSTQVKWDAASTTLEVYFDGNLRLTYTDDMVANAFGGNPSVYWGFTGATGGFSNLQQFCVTSLILGEPVVIPVSSWALVIGIFLILSVAVLRFRKSL